MSAAKLGISYLLSILVDKSASMRRYTCLLLIRTSIALLVASPVATHAQDVRWPVTYYSKKGPRRIVYPDVREGFVVTSSGDTVRGFIKLSPGTGFYYAVLDTATKRIRNIDIPDIVQIRVYLDPQKRSFSDYYNPPHQNSMWLLLATKQRFSLYERSLELSPKRIVLVGPDGRKVKVCSGRMNLIRSNDPEDILIRFIKKRYGTTLKQPFATLQDGYQFILDHEIERSAAVSKTRR